MTATEVLFFGSILYLAKNHQDLSFFRLSFSLQKKRLIQLIFIVLTLGKIILQYYFYEESFAHTETIFMNIKLRRLNKSTGLLLLCESTFGLAKQQNSVPDSDCQD